MTGLEYPSQFGRVFSHTRTWANFCAWVVVSLSAFLPLHEASANSKVTYHGRILKSDNTPLEGNVDFKIQILDSVGQCLLYEENQSLTVKDGIFSLAIGTGNEISGLNTSIEDIFKSHGTLQGKPVGGSGSCSPADSGRLLAISFSVDGGVWEQVPPTSINSVPLSIEAQNAQSVGGFAVENLVRVQGTTGITALTQGEADELLKLVKGQSDLYLRFNGDGVPTLPSYSGPVPPAGSIWFDGGKIKYSDGTQIIELGSGGGGGSSITVGAGLIESGGTISVNFGTTAGTVAAGDDPRFDEAVKKTGDTMTGPLVLPSDGLVVGGTELVVSGGNVGIGTATPEAKLDVAGAIKIAGTGSEPCAGGNVGTLRYNGGNLQFCNGSNWQTLGVSGAGLQSLNGQTGSTQTLEVELAGTTPDFVSASDVHKLQIPMASDAGVTAGLISNSDYQSFSSKLGSNLSAGRILVGNASNQATAVQPSGDVSMNSSGAFTVTGLQGGALSATPPVDGQVLKYVGGGTDEWQPTNITFADIKNGLGNSAFNVGSCSPGQTIKWSSLTDTFTCEDIAIATAQVTDMTTLGRSLATAANAAAARTVLSAMEHVAPGASGNVLQSDGTNWVSAPLSVTPAGFGAQAQNSVLAGPANGGSGTATFRALEASDIPNLDAGKITSGQFDIARIPTGTTAGTVAAGDDSRIENAVQRTGDTMSGTLNLPSDGLVVGGTQLVASSNRIGIGVATPGKTFDVVGSSRFAPATVTYSSGSYGTTVSEFVTRNADGAVSGVHVYRSGVNSGTFLTSSRQSRAAWSTGVYLHDAGGNMSASDFRAVETTGAALVQHDGSFQFLSGSGMTAGSPSTMTEKVRITSDGKVGIGTTNPTDMLTVMGGIFARALDIENDGSGFGLYADDGGDGNHLWSYRDFSIKLFDGSNNHFVTFKNDGNVGIGTTSPSEKLEVDGNVLAQAYLVSSDERLKYDIQTLKNAIDIILKLRGVSFKWKATDREDIGFIAQEIEEVLPELVHTDPNTGRKSVQYANVVAVLVAAIQEQQKQINDLDARLRKIEEKLK